METQISELVQQSGKKKKNENVGKVYRGVTKYIDPDTKPKRNYVVVSESKKGVAVAKLKSIKQFGEDGKNLDEALVEINAKAYGLKKRTGVDYQQFNQNRMSEKPLKLEDKRVFPNDKEEFKLGSHDLYRVLKHTKKEGTKKSLNARSEHHYSQSKNDNLAPTTNQ